MYINIKSNILIHYLVGEKMENRVNPLKQYFRKPGIWIKLPSQGNFYKIKPADLNEMGEIPIYPLTAKDELMLKNADALLNGSAISQMIASCAPCITDPMSMLAIDLDAILVAIRRCTYGDSNDVTCTCTNCATENEVSVNLNHIISSIKVIEKLQPITFDNGIKVFIKPVTVTNLLSLNWVQFEQIRNIQIAEQNNADETTKVDLMQKSYQLLTEKNIEIIGSCIDTVLLPDDVAVADSNDIRDWINDLSKPDFAKIEESIMMTSSMGIDKEFSVTCKNCNTNFKSSLDLNPTTFFA
jgi:hypothetical protein